MLNFKKKVTTPPKKINAIKMNIEDLPTKALELTYEEFMKDYEKKPDNKIQQKLILISKILNERAYDQGNGRLKKEAVARGWITDEGFDKLSRNEKDTLKKFFEQEEKLRKSMTELSEPEPQTIEFEAHIETPTKMQTESEHVSLEKKPEIIQEPTLQTSKPKKKGWLAKLNQPVFPQDQKKILKSGGTITENELGKKKGFSFLKKKVKKKPIHVESSDQIKTVTKEEHKESRLKGFMAKKKKKDDNKPSFKGLEEVYCKECKHSIKAHQKNGVSSGCNKCGCLSTIEEIAEQKGIQLHKPKEVLEKIEKENTAQPELKDQDEEYIKAQAAKIASMQTKPKERPRLQPPKQTVPAGDYTPKMPPEVPPKIQSNEPCICDHTPEDHYNGNEFCQVKDCMCEKFKPYPP